MNEDALGRMNTARTTGGYLSDVEDADTARSPEDIQAWEFGYIPLARIGGENAVRLTIDGIVLTADISTITARFCTPESSMLIDALTNEGRAHDPLDDAYHQQPFTYERLRDFEREVQYAFRSKAQFVPDPADPSVRWFMKTRNGVAGHPYENPEMRIKTAPNQARAIETLARRYARIRE